jgi:hypothetical protein
MPNILMHHFFFKPINCPGIYVSQMVKRLLTSDHSVEIPQIFTARLYGKDYILQVIMVTYTDVK